jgi:hypothetical protein
MKGDAEMSQHAESFCNDDIREQEESSLSKKGKVRETSGAPVRRASILF